MMPELVDLRVEVDIGRVDWLRFRHGSSPQWPHDHLTCWRRLETPVWHLRLEEVTPWMLVINSAGILDLVG